MSESEVPERPEDRLKKQNPVARLRVLSRILVLVKPHWARLLVSVFSLLVG